MMRRLAQDTQRIFLSVGVTDFRENISGLLVMLIMQFQLDPFQETCVFIFCNKKRDLIKVLRYDREAQKLAQNLGVERKKITVKPYTRSSRKPGVRAEMLASLPQDIVEYTHTGRRNLQRMRRPVGSRGKGRLSEQRWSLN